MAADVAASTTFAEQGFVRLPGVLEASTVQTLLEAMRDLAASAPVGAVGDDFGAALRASSTGATVFWDPSLGEVAAVAPEQRWSRAARVGHAVHLVESRVREVLSSPKVLDAVHQGLEGPLVLLTSVFICKQPGGSVEFGAHQDTTYLQPKPERMASLMISLDDADASNGCLFVAPGSHRLPTRTLARPAGGDWEEEQLDDHRVPKCTEPVPLEAGSAVLYDGRLYHGSEVNQSDRPRRVLIAQYAPAGVEWRASNWLEPPVDGFLRVG